MRPVLLFLFATLAADAHAYCIYNGLRERSVSVVQEEHPERSREARKLDITLKPGQTHCCKWQDLDCNPGGREENVVGLRFTIVGEPEIQCGLPGGKYKENQVTVTGTGSLRVMPNARPSAGVPYVIRARARDGKDLSGPAGIACRKPSRD